MTAILINPLFPLPWVLIAALLVLGFLGWLEIRRHQKLLALRLFSLLIAVISIVSLVLNPSWPIRKSSNTILLTPDYNAGTLDSLLTSNPNSQVYTLPTVSTSARAIEILNYRDLSDLHGNLFVLGEGIPHYMREYIDTSAVQYFPSIQPEGFTGINVHEIYTANQPAKLAGRVTLHTNGYVALANPANPEDSIHLTGKNEQSFSLTFTPKTSGLFTYTLTASDSAGQKRHIEQVPVHVKEAKSLSILFLNDFPSAEMRFLKNFLEQENHKLTLRYRISKDKYRMEFVNTPQKKLGRLNQKLLQDYDLVLADVSSLASLSREELQELKEANTNGLGILTHINEDAVPNSIKDLIFVKLTKIKNDSAQLVINTHRMKIPATPVSVSSDKKLFTVHQDVSGRTVSAYYHTGIGKSGFQLLNNTFSLALAGQKEAYAGLWSPLIEAVSRQDIKEYDLIFTTPFPYYQGEPVEFKIISGSVKPSVRTDSVEISLLEDPILNNVWHGKIWAAEPGWNTLEIEQDTSRHNFFVARTGSWRSLQVVNQQNSLKKISSSKEPGTEQLRFQPVPALIFFILFLLAVGFLWLVPKL